MSKTYLLLWNENNKLEINTFSSFKEAKRYKSFIGKDKKPKITKVKFSVVAW